MKTPVRKTYPSDVTDAQWAILEPLVPASKHGGRPRTVDVREIINTILYLSRTGCQWDSSRTTCFICWSIPWGCVWSC
jgi:putative transposase